MRICMDVGNVLRAGIMVITVDNSYYFTLLPLLSLIFYTISIDILLLMPYSDG